MDDRNIEDDIRAIRTMVAWITLIVVVGALVALAFAAGYWIEMGR